MNQPKKQLKLLHLAPIFLNHSGLNLKTRGQVEALKKTYKTTNLSLHDFSKSAFTAALWGYLFFNIRAYFSALTHNVIYCRYNPKMPFLNSYLAVLSIIKPVIFEINADYDRELAELHCGFTQLLHRLQLVVFSWFSVAILVVHKQTQKALQKRGLNAVYHLLNGYQPLVDQPELSVEDKQAIDAVLDFKRSNTGSWLGVFIGNGSPWHGISVLKDLVVRYPRVAIVLIGPYPDSDTHERLLKIPKVSPAALKELYRHSHFGIGSLNWQLIGITEGTPLKTCEYLYYGLPILVNYHDWNSQYLSLKSYIYDMPQEPAALDRLLSNRVQMQTNLAQIRRDLSWETRLVPLLKTIFEKRL